MPAKTAKLKNAPKTSRRQDTDEALRRRAEELKDAAIDFIPSQEFRDQPTEPNAVVDEALAQDKALSCTASDLPPHLGRMCAAELLSPEQERACFQEMNYLKWQAHQRRGQLRLDSIDERELDAIDGLLARAQRIRDHIIKANMRLAFSVVKKYTTPTMPFDEILSDAVCTLMQAVEKFDYSRGYRFSTYAYRSIARTAYRSVATAHREEARLARNAEEWAFEQQEDESPSRATEEMWSRVRGVAASLLNRLDRRERFIIRSRYALGAHRKARSFQDLANRLGISKERARQLEMRAVNKLRNMAAEHDPDELFGVVAV